MMPARQPASISPRPCASLKKPHESCPFAASCVPRRKKSDCGQRSAFLQKPPRSRFRFSRTRVQPSPGSSTIELPSAFAESGAYPHARELPGSPRQCSLPLLSRVPVKSIGVCPCCYCCYSMSKSLLLKRKITTSLIHLWVVNI